MARSGSTAADVDALDQFLAASGVREFEINPLTVGAMGQGLRPVDALVING